jgi:hypothetical protein
MEKLPLLQENYILYCGAESNKALCTTVNLVFSMLMILLPMAIVLL